VDEIVFADISLWAAAVNADNANAAIKVCRHRS